MEETPTPHPVIRRHSGENTPASPWDTVRPILLVADADPQAYQDLARHCEDNHVQVHTADTGADALILFGRHTPDLIVISSELPGVPWQDVAAAVRTHDPVPVILGAQDQRLFNSSGILRPGLDEVLPRPYQQGRSSALARLLQEGRTSRRPDPVLSVGGLTLDAVAFRVSTGDTPIPVTLREFELLRLVMLHHGEVISAETISIGVWGAAGAVHPHSIKILVSRLRAKLPPSVRLTTVRGRGYRLETVEHLSGAAPEP